MSHHVKSRLSGNPGLFASSTGAHSTDLPLPANPASGILTELLGADEFAISAAAAERWQVPQIAAALALGFVQEADYARAMSRRLRLPYAESGLNFAGKASEADRALSRRWSAPPVELDWQGRPVVALAVGQLASADVKDSVDRIVARGRFPVITTEVDIVAALHPAAAPHLIDRATRSLLRLRPDVSAASFGPWRQIAWLVLAAGVPAGALLIEPRIVTTAIAVLLAAFFATVVLLRLVALREAVRPNRNWSHGKITRDADLPIYSVLVPLRDEAGVVGDLVAALSALDYPKAKLDILLVLEAPDLSTIAAVAALPLPPYVRAIVVPDGLPRTKPKALNYALAFARGAYVVVYDAEDRPERDQLLQALYAFENAGADIACVQAPLNIYNARQNWLSRQFALEYSSLFDATLPALDRLGFAVPLGGTSNHFPRAVLDAMLGWDPYNVTEDADLGIRIARRRWRTVMIASTTWEEAPVEFGQWLRQRTRWIKGWLQTILVHTRRHKRLRRDLGPWRTFGFHIYMGGLVASALTHPWVYLGFMADYALHRAGIALIGVEPLLPEAFWLLAVTTLVTGYVTAILSNAITAAKRGHSWLLTSCLTPVYWLLISLAAYRALIQLIFDPYRWEKTSHGLPPRRPRRRRK